MTMKNLLCLVTASLLFQSVLAGAPNHKWNAIITVLDESGSPVSDADVEMSFYVTPSGGQHEAAGSVHDLTDKNGVVRLSHSSTGSIGLSFYATKTGYYPTTKGYRQAELKDGDPKKWNPTETLVLKKVIEPIPMYAKWINTHVPLPDKPFGYDLMVGDWVAPYGKGSKGDILFSRHTEKMSNGQTVTTLAVSFPNQGDGIQEFDAPALLQDALDGQSALRSAQTAPLDGYKPVFHRVGPKNANRNYYLRVHTVLDEKGNIKSALYGKIYGDFMRFTYYLNPTPNDRNVEFDPKHNLLKEKV